LGPGTPFLLTPFFFFVCTFVGGNAYQSIRTMNLSPDSYEFQMLYGGRLNLPDEIVRRGLIRKQPAESAESFDLTCGCLLSILERQAAKNKEAAP
jgi:hypothetical protein